MSVPGAVFLPGVAFTPAGSTLVLVDTPNNAIQDATVSGGTWITGAWTFGGPLTLPDAGSNDAYALALTIEVGPASPTEVWIPTGVVVPEDSASVWVVTRAPDKIRRIDAATNLVVPADDIDLPEPNDAPLAAQRNSTRLWAGHYGYPAIQILSADTV